MNIEIKFTCDKCDKSFDEIDSNVYCDNCDGNDDKYAYETVKSAIEEAYKQKYVWQDKEHYIGFKSDEEKDIFLDGVKHGYLVCLFNVSNYMGDEGICFFEEMAKEDWK